MTTKIDILQKQKHEADERLRKAEKITRELRDINSDISQLSKQNLQVDFSWISDEQRTISFCSTYLTMQRFQAHVIKYLQDVKQELEEQLEVI